MVKVGAAGGTRTVKPEKLAVPAPAVTTSTGPETAPEGTVTVIWASVAVKLRAWTAVESGPPGGGGETDWGWLPLKSTWTVPLRLEPAMVTFWPGYWLAGWMPEIPADGAGELELEPQAQRVDRTIRSPASCMIK